MQGTYNPWLVALSIGVAMIASYVALDLVSRVAATRKAPSARYWLAGGAVSMGVGIWSMHFIGMLALSLPMPMAYDTTGTLFSLLIAIVVSGLALHTASTGTFDARRVSTAGICMGLGIAAMQYGGMESIEVAPAIRYDPALMTASTVIAIAASIVALWIAFRLRIATPLAAWPKKAYATVLMGLAITGAHYIGMAAATFQPGSYSTGAPTDISNTALALVVGGFASLVLLAALLASIVDARLADRSSRMAEAMRAANAALEQGSAELMRANERLRQEAEEREKTKVALHESEARYRLFTSLSTDWSWEQDAELRFIDLPEKEIYCGITRANHIGKRRWELPNSEAVNTTWEEHKAVLQARKEFRNLIIRRMDEDGTAHYAIVSGSPIFDASGNFKGYRGVGADITDRLAAEERFRATFDQTAVGIAHISFDHRHLLVNKKYCDMLGYSADELLALDADAVILADGAGEMSESRALLHAGDIDHYSGERQYVRKNGAVFWVNRTISIARDGRGRPLYYIRVIEDISERKAVQMAHQRGEAEFSTLFNQAAIGMAQTDMDGVFLRVNAKLCDMLGYAPSELLGRRFKEITHRDDLERNLDLLAKLATGEIGEYTYEKRYLRKDGSPLWVSVTMSRTRVSAIESPFALAVIEDISERRRAEERLTYLAQYDSLTGLPNRSLVRDRLSLAIARAERNAQPLAVLFVDLDDFSDINDSLGHACGDEVLQAAAGVLRTSLRDVDTIGRLGGDEFTIILENIAGADEVAAVAEKVRKSLADPIAIAGREIFVSASIGIALYPENGMSVDALLQAADSAMYHAKNLGRNCYALGSSAITAEAGERVRMSALLRRALERGEFLLHYQPIIDLKSRSVVGLEALVRLNSSTEGMVSPARFIPLAESTGLIVPLGEWVLRTACLQAKAWQTPGEPPLTISVNISARQLRGRGFVQTIEHVLAETGLPAHCLTLEITESQLMEDTKETMEKLAAIRRLGVGLAMDDFGTGYSSLGNLAKLPVQVLKIDRSFVSRMLDDSDAMALVSTILTLARTLRLKVVAEGVETEGQEKALRLLRCDEMQGFLFSRPLGVADMTALLTRCYRERSGAATAAADTA
jgi:diguanylate cyclase (GGDEF)-like protein/PAS domain S-box-containing protein